MGKITAPYLLVDVGNTRTKMRWAKAGQTLDFVFDAAAPAKEIENVLAPLDVPALAMLCSVAPKRTLPWREILSGLGVVLREVSGSMPLPFSVAYGTPQTLGADRIAAAAGAHHGARTENVLVVDLGTCITYEHLHMGAGGAWKYQPGPISPGLQMRLQAMHTQTGALPLATLSELSDGFSASALPGSLPLPLAGTREALAQGAVLGIVDEIIGMAHRYGATKAHATLLLTGGDSSFFESLLPVRTFATPNLVFDGLQALLFFNP